MTQYWNKVGTVGDLIKALQSLERNSLDDTPVKDLEIRLELPTVEVECPNCKRALSIEDTTNHWLGSMEYLYGSGYEEGGEVAFNSGESFDGEAIDILKEKARWKKQRERDKAVAKGEIMK